MNTFTPYLTLDGNCREAMTFYQGCFGGELYTMTFGEANAGGPDSPESKDRLIHARLSGDNIAIMASDTMPGMQYDAGNNVSLSLGCNSNDEVDRLYAALSNGGGKGTMPPADQFWGSYFAMVTDKFGFHWMLGHEHVKQG
jgi:PhnB protein